MSECMYVAAVAMPLIVLWSVAVFLDVREERRRLARLQLLAEHDRLVAQAVRDWQVAGGWRRW